MALALGFCGFAPSLAFSQDLSGASIVAAPSTGPQRAVIQMLADEVRSRTQRVWPVRSVAPSAGALVVVGRRAQIASLLTPSLRRRWRAAGLVRTAPEGFSVRRLSDPHHVVVIIAADDDRGELYGVGYLLRKLETEPGAARLSRPIDITTAPAQPVRGSQFGYRFKNNTYDAWTVPMFEQRIREFAIFGANTIQVIAPNSDDEADSPLFPAPPLPTLTGIGLAAHKYGLDFALYYPEMADDYAAPGAVAAELGRFQALVDHLPRIDVLYVPGGDPGHTPPDLLFPLVAQEAAILRRANPAARIWISGQGFDKARYAAFYAQLDRRPAWLTGVFFGPQSRDPMSVQRARIPARYPIQFYPDIGHVMHAQFPAPQWDPVFALTEGREPIDPRPRAETAIFRHFAPLNRGFVTYSEGVNDDVNALLWFQLGWSPQADPSNVLNDYARTFLGARIGAQSSDAFAACLQALERDWDGPPQDNPAIGQTLNALTRLEQDASPAQQRNWRFESALYRGVYDAYVQARATAETRREQAALQVLAAAPKLSAAKAIASARTALAEQDGAATQALRARLFDLADRLYADVRLQLSVRLYGASGVERGANLDRVDVSMNDRVWLEHQFDAIARLPDEPARLARLANIVDWADTRDGALHDDLGDPLGEPHLVRGLGFDRDPQFYDTAIDGVADMTPDDGWRMSQLSYAETLYDRPMILAYQGLDPGRAYRLRVTYAGEGYHAPMRLVANGTLELQPPTDRPANPTTLEIDLPRAATASGSLRLQWTGPLDGGGSGRGHQVAEVWLIPSPPPEPSHAP